MSVWDRTKATEPREFQSFRALTFPHCALRRLSFLHYCALQFGWFFPTVHCSGWVWLTPTLENQWLDADKILPAAFLSDTHQFSFRFTSGAKTPNFFLWNSALIRRKSTTVEMKTVSRALSLFHMCNLLNQIRAQGGFSRTVEICTYTTLGCDFMAFRLNRLWSWRGKLERARKQVCE